MWNESGLEIAPAGSLPRLFSHFPLAQDLSSLLSFLASGSFRIAGAQPHANPRGWENGRDELTEGPQEASREKDVGVWFRVSAL